MKTFLLNYLLGPLGTELQTMSIKSFNSIMRVLGKAFGPDGCRHYSELRVDEKAELLRRVPVLRESHSDWPKPFRWVKRSDTVYVTPNNEPPPVIAGSVEGHVDIPSPGTYVATRGYIAMTTENGWHFRAGFRWDTVDSYSEFPSFTIKRVNLK